MTTGKILNSPASIASQLKRLDPQTQTTNVAPVTKSEAVVTKEVKPESLFGAKSNALETVTGPQGEAVSKTALPNALWGQVALEGSKPPLSALTLKNLSPEQAKTKLAELEKRKTALEERIGGRMEELDHKWNYMRLTKRTEILKSYIAQSGALPPEQRAEVETAIKDSEGAQAKIDDLMADVKALKAAHPGAKKPGTPEERKELAKKLWAARHEHSEAVKGATEAVDDAGLKIERLVITENQIDPTGGANSQYGSMAGLVGQYFEVTFMMDTVQQLYFGPMASMVKELNRQAADGEKRKIIENHWRERDDLMRRMLKDLPLKVDKRNAPVEAVKTRNLGKMSAAAATTLANKTRAD